MTCNQSFATPQLHASLVGNLLVQTVRFRYGDLHQCMSQTLPPLCTGQALIKGTSKPTQMNETKIGTAVCFLPLYMKILENSNRETRKKIATQNLVKVCTKPEFKSLAGNYFSRLTQFSSATCDPAFGFHFHGNGWRQKKFT